MDLMMVVSSELLGLVFGKSVRKVRKAQGMKQEVLAEAVGYSRPRMSEIENGDLPPFDKAVSIANVLGVPLGCLISPIVLAQEPGTASLFFQHILHATPQEQRKFVELVEALLEEVKLVVAAS